MVSLTELPFKTWISGVASIVAVTSGLVALSRRLAGVPVGHAIGGSLIWAVRVYLFGLLVLAIASLYKRRHETARTVCLRSALAGFALAAFYYGLAEMPDNLEDRIFGAVVVAVALCFGAVIYVVQFKAARKHCPDCAETVKTKARVCHFCGYRFEPRLTSSAVCITR